MTGFNFSDRHIRVAAKAAREGVDSLTPEERELYDQLLELGKAAAKHFRGNSTPEQRKHMQEGYEAWEAMSWADQLRYEDWTPLQLWAFLPLIDDHEGP